MLDHTPDTTTRRRDPAQSVWSDGAVNGKSIQHDMSAIADILGDTASAAPLDAPAAARSWLRSKWMVAFGLTVAIVLLAWMATTLVNRGADPYPAGSASTYTVKRADLLITVTEDGSLESAENLDIKCEVSGGTTIVWIIEDGKKVTKGTELLRLDSSKLSEDVSAQEIAYEKAVAASVQSAKDYAAAKIAVEEYIEGTFKKDFREAESKVAVAQVNLTSAENSLQYSQRMFRKGYITAQQLETAKTAVERSKLELGSAEIARDVMKKYTRPKMVQELESKRDAAEAKCKGDKNSLTLEEAKLKRLKSKLDKCIIVAPKDGLVIYANERMFYGDRDSEIKAGMKVYEENTILKLPNLGKMQVEVGIHEAKVDRIRPGLRARIRVQDRDFQGSVVSVANRPQGNWFFSSVKKYPVKVKIDGEPKDLRPGLTAEVEILVAHLSNVISLPVAAVAEKNGQFHGCVKNGSKLERRDLVLGLSNDKFVEVKEGVDVDETVVLNPRAALGEKDDESQKQPDVDVQSKFGDGKAEQNTESKSGGKKP
jgi:HlyD family secretion protein